MFIIINNSESQLPGNHAFGWLVAAISGVACVYAHSHSWNRSSVALAFLTFLLLVTTLFVPKLLTPLNLLWYRFGLVLGKAFSPIVLGVIFFAVITPLSLVMRLFGRDELKIKKRVVESYWVDRSPLSHQPESFKNQY